MAMESPSHYYNPGLEAELQELGRLVKCRRLLELPVSLFKHYARNNCRGECSKEYQVKIGVLGLTCCHFYMQQEYYQTVLRQEKELREYISAVREQQRKRRTRAATYSAL